MVDSEFRIGDLIVDPQSTIYYSNGMLSGLMAG